MKAVLFDLDETLIVEEEAVQGALQAVAARFQAEHGIDVATLARAVRRSARSRWRAAPTHAWADQIGISSGEMLGGRFLGQDGNLAAIRRSVPAFRVGAWADALLEHGVRDEALAARLAEAYRIEHPSRRTVYPDVVAALGRLRERYRLALVTNGAPDLQREKISSSQLDPWFEVITVSGEVGVGKPHPLVFETTLRALGVEAREAVMVGDSVERDVEGAIAAGLHAVWCDRRGKAPPEERTPRHRITTLDELPAILDRIEDR